jgi:hypothetical protein
MMAAASALEGIAMPRRSASDIALSPLLVPADDRPERPADMGEAAAAIWRGVVGAMRSRWFTGENRDLLVRYCNAMAEASRLEAELARVGVGLPSYDRLSQRYNAMATLALSYARALRLTPRANKESKIDDRDARRSNYPRPWEHPPPARPQKKPWDD